MAPERPKRSGNTVRCIAHDRSTLACSDRGRYWDRTSDLCSVKVSGGSFARLQNRGYTATGLVHYGFPPLIVSHRFAVVSGVMWTRCGRESPPRGSGLRLQQRLRSTSRGFSPETSLRVGSHRLADSTRTLMGAAQASTSRPMSPFAAGEVSLERWEGNDIFGATCGAFGGNDVPE